jgi:hypothetical protein
VRVSPRSRLATGGATREGGPHEGRGPPSLVAPSSFMYLSWDGVSTDWGYQLQPNRPIFDLLRSPPEEQRFLSKLFRSDQIWFAMTRRSTLERSIRRVLQCNSGVITVYKREVLVAASKGSFRSGSLKAILLWASNLKALGTKRSFKRQAESGRLH